MDNIYLLLNIYKLVKFVNPTLYLKENCRKLFRKIRKIKNE